MDFQWPARRHDSISTRDSLLIAVSLTGAAAFALTTPVASSFAIARDGVVLPISIPVEALTYVRPLAPRPPVEPPRTTKASPKQLTAAPAPERTSPPAAVDAPPVRADSAAPTIAPTDVPKALPRATAPAGAVWSSNAFSTKRELSGEERMAVLGEALSRPMVDLGGWRLVPQDERTGHISEEERRMREQRLYEPANVAGKPGYSVGFLGKGPSKEQRRRDSIAHHDNLLRLTRLADRAKARRDSMQKAARP